MSWLNCVFYSKLYFSQSVAATLWPHWRHKPCIYLDKIKIKTWLVILTLKAPPIICSRRQFQILLLFQKKNKAWYFMRIVWLSAGRRFSWNIIPYFFQKLEKMLQNLSSAAVVIGALRVIYLPGGGTPSCLFLTSCSLFILSRYWWYASYFPLLPLSPPAPTCYKL